MGHVLSTMLVGFPYFMVMFALPLRMQVVSQKTALMAGISLLPTLGTVAIGSVIGGAVNGNRDYKFPTLVLGSIFMTIGCAALSTIDATGGSQGGIYGFQVFVGLGFGVLISTVSAAAAMECEIRDNSTSPSTSHFAPANKTTAVAQGIIAQVRIFGGSIGIAASTAILGASQRRNLTGLVSPSQLANLQSFSKTASIEQLRAIQKTYSEAFSTDMKVSAAVAGAAVLAAVLTFQREKVDVQERHKERHIEEGKRQRALAEAKSKASRGNAV